MTDGKEATALVDASGNGRSAHLEGNPQPGGGKNANALVFSGETANQAVFESPELTALTFAAWINVSGMGEGDKPYPRIVELSGCFLHVNQQEPNRLGLTFRAGNASWTAAGKTFAPDAWTHVAVTYDGTNPSQPPVFYLNGHPVPYASGKLPESPVTIRGGKGVIGNNASRNRPFQGLISDVRIYSTNLAADEVKAIFGALRTASPPRMSPSSTPTSSPSSTFPTGPTAKWSSQPGPRRPIRDTPPPSSCRTTAPCSPSGPTSMAVPAARWPAATTSG
jgi:hypothetical protein